VLAIGNPFGVGQTVTSGIISALARTEVGNSEAQVFIQTDAAINPGNSGGALVDMAGRVVGINTAIFSRSGGSHGVGFAIPSNGARVAKTLPGKADELGIEDQEGVVILQVRPESRAARIGFQAGDVIQQVGRVKIQTVSELEAVVKERQQVWQIVLKRGNQTMRLQLAG